jgi:hypothetical protein
VGTAEQQEGGIKSTVFRVGIFPASFALYNLLAMASMTKSNDNPFRRARNRNRRARHASSHSPPHTLGRQIRALIRPTETERTSKRIIRIRIPRRVPPNRSVVSEGGTGVSPLTFPFPSSCCRKRQRAGAEKREGGIATPEFRIRVYFAERSGSSSS